MILPARYVYSYMSRTCLNFNDVVFQCISGQSFCVTEKRTWFTRVSLTTTRRRLIVLLQRGRVAVHIVHVRRDTTSVTIGLNLV